MPEREANGVRLHYTLTEGPGPGLTLVHGGYLDSNAWEMHVGRLSAACTVLTLDVRGYGASEHPAEPWTVSDWGSDLLALWDELEIPASYLLGFSMGGLIAQDVASREPGRVPGLILVSTTARFTDEVRENYRTAAAGFDAARYDQSLARHLEVAFSPGFRAERPEFMASYEMRARTTPIESVRNTMLALADADYRGELPRIDLPSLVVHGDEDLVTGGEHPATLLAGLPRAEERLVPGAGHTVHLEQPELFCEIVGDFVQRTESVRAAEAGAGAAG